MNKTIFSLIAAGLIAFGSAGAGDDSISGKSLSKSEIEQLIQHPQSDQRQEVAKSILNAMDSDTTWAFETII